MKIASFRYHLSTFPSPFGPWKLNYQWHNFESTENLTVLEFNSVTFSIFRRKFDFLFIDIVFTQPNVIDWTKMSPDMDYWGLSLDILYLSMIYKLFEKGPSEWIGTLSSFFFSIKFYFGDGKIRWATWKSLSVW